MVPFLLFYCIYACATGGNPELLSDEELAEAQAKRKILEAAQAAIASEPGVPDSADDIVELSLALPLEGPPADGLLGINTSGDVHGNGVVFRGFKEERREHNRLFRLGVIYDGCRIVAVSHMVGQGGFYNVLGRIELGGLRHPVALKVLELHVNEEWRKQITSGVDEAPRYSVLIEVAAPNAFSAPKAQDQEQDSAMPVEQAQAEASMVVLRNAFDSPLATCIPDQLKMAPHENELPIKRFRESASCVKIMVPGIYFSIYGMGATYTSFVKYERASSAKMDDTNSFNGEWLVGGLVFGGFSAPDCELARMGFLVEGCHLVGVVIQSGFGDRNPAFRPIKGFKEDEDVRMNLLAFPGTRLVFRNVAKEQT